MTDDEERLSRLARSLQLKTLKRATVISQIRSIHDMAVRVCTDNSLNLVYAFHATDIDSLWHEFKCFDLSVLNSLFELSRADEYSHALHSTMRKLVDESKTVLAQMRPTGAERIISKAHPKTFESVPHIMSRTARGLRTCFPSGLFSEVFPSRPSASNTLSAVSRTIVVQSLTRDYIILVCCLIVCRWSSWCLCSDPCR